MIIKKSIGDYVEESLKIFGSEVNNNRQIAYVYDGLKTVYRRVITIALRYNKMIKTARIVGDCLGELHPHGDSSVKEVVDNLVRFGIFDGQGNHGKKLIRGVDATAAAMRYTEAMISQKYRDFFESLMPFVPYVEGELDAMEPEYLPTPLPIGLLFPRSGIGFGVNCRYPMFTMKSMYEALINDDPFKLESPYGMVLNKEKSEMKKLWTKGMGKLTYEYVVKMDELESGKGVMVSGSPELFKPNIDSKFADEINKGQIYFIDQTSGDDTKLFIGKSWGIKQFTVEDLYEKCKKIFTETKPYRLTVSFGKETSIIPLREWLNLTYNNYLSLIEVFKENKVKKYEFEKRVYEVLPIVAKCQLEHREFDPKMVSEYTKIDLEIVRSVLSKPISALRMTDSSSKIEEMDKKIKYYKGISGKKFVKDIIDEFK